MGISSGLAHGQETVTVALTSKAFQYTILPIAQDRGYLKEEGIELKLVYMQNAPGLQALTAGNVQFSGSAARWWQFQKAAHLSKLLSLPMIRFCNGW
jgi:ABC-type nitrate/sulfonate/bicarbonate transport system substrate-binding protein